MNERITAGMFRVNGEIWALFICVLVFLTLAILLFSINIWVMAVITLIGLLTVKLQQSQYLGNAVKVQEEQFPELFSIFEEFATKLSLRDVELFIRQDPTLNAFTIGITRPCVIVTSALAEQFSHEEAEFVIGHELGHIKAGHNIVLSFISPVGKSTAWGSLIFGFWQRKAEYSADRCGLALSKKIDTAITSLLKLAVGSVLFKKMDIGSFAAQIRGSEAKWVKLSQVLIDHPLITNRIKYLLIFWKDKFTMVSNEM